MTDTAAVPQYSVVTFLTWLLAHTSDTLSGASRKGCREIRVAARSWQTIGEDLAQQWADTYDVDVESIWGDGVYREEPLPEPVSLVGAAGGPTSPLPIWGDAVHGDEPTIEQGPQPVPVGETSPQSVPVLSVVPDLAASGVTISSMVRMVDLPPLLPPLGVFDPDPKTATNVPESPPVPMPMPLPMGTQLPNPAPEPKAASGHVTRLTPDQRSRPLRAGYAPCPICQVPQLVKAGMRNHVRHAHKRDPDELFGIPTYRSRGPLSAQQDGAPQPPLPPLPPPAAPDADVWLRDWRRRYLDLLLSWASEDGPNTELLGLIEREYERLVAG